MPSNLNLDYYYGNEAEQYSFLPHPQGPADGPSVQERFHRGEGPLWPSAGPDGAVCQKRLDGQ